METLSTILFYVVIFALSFWVGSKAMVAGREGKFWPVLFSAGFAIYATVVFLVYGSVIMGLFAALFIWFTATDWKRFMERRDQVATNE